MSRIAGLVSAHPQESAVLTREALLPGLPGIAQRISQAGRAAFGWKGWSEDACNTHVFADGSMLVAIDGVVLNAAMVRRSVAAPDGDAALVAALYRKHGFEDTLAALDGDLAVAVYDQGTGILWLGRDRFGVKPMYYTKRLPEGRIAFASQPAALLRLQGLSSAPNKGFVARFAGSHYRTFDNLPEESPYESIAQLPAGHVVALSCGDSGSARAYWSLTDRSDFEEDEEVLAERYRELLVNAVGRRTAHAERPIFSLSGGLDSSSVLCSAAHLAGQKQPAVSCVYTDATYDERDEIADVVREQVSRWYALEIPNRIDLVDSVRHLVSIHGEPVATATWLSHHLLAQHVQASGFKTLFGGLGGDELNAGEYEYFPMHFADLAASGMTRALEDNVAGWTRHHDHPIFRKSPEIAAGMVARLTDPAIPGRCLPDWPRLRRYSDCVNPEFYDLARFVPTMDAPFGSYLKNRTFQDMFRETLPCCLRAEDRQCAAAGIAHFAPFLDRELVEFMYRVPGTLKIRDGITKHLLRRATAGILPDRTRLRIKKTGWNAPAHVWFDRRALDALRDLVGSVAVRKHGIYDLQRVEDTIADHIRIVESGVAQENHMMFLWQALNLCIWLHGLDRPAGLAAGGMERLESR